MKGFRLIPALILAMSLAACGADQITYVPAEAEPTLGIAVEFPSFGEGTRSDVGELPASELENALHSLTVWVFRSDDHSVVAAREISESDFPVGGGVRRYSLPVTRSFVREMPDVDVFVLANAASIGSPLQVGSDWDALNEAFFADSETAPYYGFMANCATALVVDTLGSGIRKLEVYASGFATGFNLCDSTYIFQYTPYVKPDRLEVPGIGTACYAAVHFPSRDTRPATRTVTQTEAPFLSDPSPDPLWRYWVYATLPDGTVTQNRLAVYNPVRAGQLRIIRVKLYGNGSVVAGDPTVGVSVTMDWDGIALWFWALDQGDTAAEQEAVDYVTSAARRGSAAAVHNLEGMDVYGPARKKYEVWLELSKADNNH